MRWSLLAVPLVLATAIEAGAQAEAEEDTWKPIVNVTVGMGMVVLQTIEDGPSNSRWDFGRIHQYRVTIDRSVSADTQLGFTIGYAPIQVRYAILRQAGASNAACRPGCEADAELWTYGATLRVEAGRRVVNVIELNAMMNHYSNFRTAESDIRLAPLDGDKDVVFTAGYGFGFAASRRFQVNLMGDVGLTVHTRAGPDSDLNRVNQLIVIRAHVRSAVGG
jgi:hypothetical protein